MVLFGQENMHYFWMKNTLIPLDIIRIDKNLEVLEIISAPSCIQDPVLVMGQTNQVDGL